MASLPRGWTKLGEGNYRHDASKYGQNKLMIYGKNGTGKVPISEMDKYEKPEDGYLIEYIDKIGSSTQRVEKDDADTKEEAIENAVDVMETMSSSEDGSKGSKTDSSKIKREVRKAAKTMAARSAARNLSSELRYDEDKYDKAMAAVEDPRGTWYAVDGGDLSSLPHDLEDQGYEVMETEDMPGAYQIEVAGVLGSVVKEAKSNLGNTEESRIRTVADNMYGSSETVHLSDGEIKYYVSETTIKEEAQDFEDLIYADLRVEGKKGYHYRGGEAYEVKVLEHDGEDIRVRLEENSPFAYKGDKTWLDPSEVKLYKDQAFADISMGK